MRCRFGCEVYSESVEQPRSARRGQPQRAAVTLALEPAELETAAPDFRAYKAGEVRPTLAPIKAGPAEHALALRIQVGPEFGQESCARRGQLTAILAQDDVPVGDERVGDGNAHLSGQMVVAGAREAQRI